jgi:hypothetical protein
MGTAIVSRASLSFHRIDERRPLDFPIGKISTLHRAVLNTYL